MPQIITILPLTSIRSTEIVDDGPLVLEEIQVKTLPVPIGIPIPWPSETLPAWGVALEGQSVLRASYPVMFSIYGTVYGAVDVDHFTLPDYTGFTLVGYKATDSDFDAITKTGGEKTHTLTGAESGVPAHTHPQTEVRSGGSGNTTQGAFAGGSNPTVTGANAAANANSAHNNLQPFKVVRWIARSG